LGALAAIAAKFDGKIPQMDNFNRCTSLSGRLHGHFDRLVDCTVLSIGTINSK
jgi:hypothetical protein